MNGAPGVTDEMLECAMMWRQRMDAGDWSVDDEAALEVWLQQDEQHVRAFKRTGEVWALFDQHATSPELLNARRELLGRVQRQATGRWTGRAAVLRMPSRRMAAAVAAGAVLLGGGLWPLTTQGEIYTTGVGERRVINLRDGSTLSLDAMSRVDVRYAKDKRQLVLKRGQARFDVAKDPSRPFTVAAGDRTVVATGTAFNIDITKPEVTVTLLEGRVLVMPKPSRLPVASKAAPRPVELRPGQALVAGEHATGTLVASADIEQATAWQQGKLMFDREPLAEAVERINRYSDRKITIGDDEAASVRVSGVFNTGDVNAFLEAVNGFLPVRVIQGEKGVVLQSSHASS